VELPNNSGAHLSVRLQHPGRRRGVCVLLVATALSLAPTVTIAQEESASADVLTLEQYREALDAWIQYYDASTDDPKCCDSRPIGMPERWHVRHQGQDFTVGTAFTQTRFDSEPKAANDPISLLNAQAEHARARRRLILDRLHALRSAAAQILATPYADHQDATARAGAILARGEFRKVRMPGMRETLSDKIRDWIVNLLRKVFAKTPDLRFASRVLAWTALALALVLLAIILRRMLARQDAAFHIPRGSASTFVSAKAWQEWLREARLAADRADWREAIHLGYWAGVSALEAGGAWKPDRARTPREYLALLPASSSRHAPLTSITTMFERAWYAQRPATEDDFRDLLGRLEAIGCR
jgi:hypothetical protein